MSKIAPWPLVTVVAALLALGLGFVWGSRTGAPTGSAGARVTTLPAAGLAARATGAAGAAGSGGVTMEPAAIGSGISVVGSGTASGTPDALTLSMSVETSAPTVDAALQAANAAAAKVQAALRSSGVAEKDLQTSGMSIQPQYNYNGGTPQLTGYQVSESLTATLRDVAKAGGAISAAAQAGGNASRVNSVGLDLSDNGALLTKARAAAFQDAKDKAQQYAKAAGLTLGPVLGIQESTSSTPTPIERAPMATAAAAGSVPVAAGAQTVQVSVTVVFGMT